MSDKLESNDDTCKIHDQRSAPPLKDEKLKMNADLYAKIYDEDTALRKLTDSAISEWPE
jgi:hypothetical protein